MGRLLPAAWVVSLAASACGPASPVDTAPTATGTVAPTGSERATVVDVVDGDSLVVDLDGRREEVRLVGINAPERDECHADEARAALEGFVGGADVDLVSAPPQDRDRFGRLLRYVVGPGALPVNLLLVSGGHALALQEDHPELDAFLSADEGAYEARNGMWAKDACGPPGAAAIAITDLIYDAPGPDAENPSGESITIGNDGDAPVDLSGWMLRDESSVHRFRFPAGLVVGPGTVVRVVSGCDAPSPADLTWCADGAVWSNGGDTAILQTAEGSVVDRMRYDG